MTKNAKRATTISIAIGGTAQSSPGFEIDLRLEIHIQIQIQIRIGGEMGVSCLDDRVLGVRG